ncbi:helix-turn-helix domain-containing protein [Levilactobacillus angrenensis]|uniref:Helix-turn-helix domain-containing protein n=1 Tax=Levilactobacillus angrenensis TaxID=2486020 RepID=A0ABW1UA19_9LACO|nr:helix-turn-helix domain-containing protein [Levilactobacillus angrenensis]
MNRKCIEKKLFSFEKVELSYRKLFWACPYDDFPPVSSWRQFVGEYKKRIGEDASVRIPNTPPSDIQPRFFESQFFSDDAIQSQGKQFVNHKQLIYPPHLNTELVVFKHLRFLPIMMHTLEFVKVSYVFKGSCCLFLKGQKIALHQGDLIIVAPDIEQAFFCCDDNDIVLNIIMRRSTFQEAFSPLLMEQNDLSEFFLQMLYQKRFSQIIRFNTGNDDEIKEIILKLYEESQRSLDGSRIIMNSYVLLLFGRLIRYYAHRVSILIGNQKKQTVSNIILFIKNNQTTVTLQMVSDHFHLSLGYLSRFIKSETGMSFSDLLRELKMNAAVELLTKSNLSIEEIVTRVGYIDISNFYRNFKKMYHETPSGYRKKATR